MVSTNNYFNALLGVPERSESEDEKFDDGFTKIRRNHRGKRSNGPKIHSESQGVQQQEPNTTTRVSSSAREPAATGLSEPCSAEAISKLSLREKASEPIPVENGEAGSALSYAAVTADSRALQQLLEQLTGAGPPLPEPAGQDCAETASAAAALDRQEALLTVAADSAVSMLDVKDCQISIERGSRRPNKSQGSRLRQPLVWLDLEMTGLDMESDTIIEAACLMSDGNLETIIEGPEIAIQQSEKVLSSMNPWCIDHHGASGLTQRCRDSTTSIEKAEEQLLAFVARHTEPGEARLAGNSVHVDMQFLRRRMPRLFRHLHHRIVDVSTVAELCARWFPSEYRNAPRKKGAHTAMADIRESIEELRFYKSTIFRQQPSQPSRRRK